ncbi:MAG TPA: helix-turn-helix transcriptional regulator [Actinomycetota bacterium]|nr:helix-turn-helix transcriptional regulator [Actinomycetota bacterium]
MKGAKDAGIGGRIRALRAQKGLSQRDVAAPLLTSSYVSLIEAGKRIPSEETLEHIAARLGVDPVELRTGRSPGAEAELELRLQEARRTLHSGDREAARSLARSVRAEARKGGWRRVEAKALCVLGVVEEHEGRTEEALEHYRASEALWAGDAEHLRYEAVVGVSRCTLALGDSRLAIHILNEYLDALDRSGHPDPVAQMRAHAALVACYLQVGLRNRAAHEAELALRFAPLTDDPVELACLHMNVASSLLEQGRHADAADSARRAEEHFSMLDWKLGAAWAQMNRGIVLLEKRDLDGARGAFEAALARLGAVPNAEVDRANVLNELAQVERLSGRAARARSRLEEARALLGPGGAAVVRATNHREMGRTLAKKEPAVAERELREAMQLFREAGALRETATTARELARLLGARRKQKEAIAVLEEGLEAALQTD